MSYFSLEDIVRIGRESKEQIESLFSKKTAILFGPQLDLEHLLVTSCASFGLYDPDNKQDLIAAVCLNDYPNIPSVPPWEWCTTMGKTYNLCDDIKQISTLWFHLIVWHPNYRLLFMQFFLQAIFQNFRTLETLLLAVPPGVGRLDFFSNATPYERLMPVEEYNIKNPKFIQTVCILYRKDYVYNYRIRRAVEEDNDDLVKIINEKAPVIEDFYGEFYIAEMVIHHEKKRKIVVGEGRNGRAVGVLSLTDSINYNLLNESFELLGFHGLRKPNQSDHSTSQFFPKSEICVPTVALESEIIVSFDDNLLKNQSSSDSCAIKSDETFQYDLEEEVVLEVFQCLSDVDLFDDEESKNSVCSALMLDDEYQDHLLQNIKMSNKMSELTKGSIYVRQVQPEDSDYLQQFISKVPKVEPVLEQVQAIVDQDEIYTGYVLVCEETIVGVAVLRCEVEQDYLDAHYNINYWTSSEHHRSGSHGLIENLLMCPIFDAHGGFFLRELHRLSDFSILFYRLYPIDATLQRLRPMNNLIDYLVPILPRLLPQYDAYLKKNNSNHSILSETSNFATKEEYGFQLPSILLKHDEPCSLFLSTKYLSNVPRSYINNRIIVVGTSATAIAFLECLVFAQHYDNLFFFTNLTVVSPHGFSFQKLRDQIRDKMFVGNGHLDRYHMYSTSLMTYVNVVAGVMTFIDRKNKMITINNDSCLAYDYLILMCGEQFQRPVLNKKKILNSDIPPNVFIINTDIDAGTSFNRLKQKFLTNKSIIIIYGHHLEALCCLNCLMQCGIPAHQLIYINPLPEIDDNHEHITSFFNNQQVEEGVFKAIEDLGVKIYNGYNCIDWAIEKSLLVAIKLVSKYKVIEMECNALFYYNIKSVSTKTFQAINKAGLTFDGHLVIDKNFCTNDPYIFAAGTLTKYSRKYFADHLSHKYFNGEEIGLDLGQKIKNLVLNLEPMAEQDEEACTCPPGCSTNTLVKIYKKPVVRYCQLPGQINYVNISKPGKGVPLEVAMARNDFGHVYVTGDLDDLDNQGYFWIHLNKYGLVETITCLNKKEIYVRNLISIWGKHETLLNNLAIRFARDDITDMFEFFGEPWACAIYHDRFNNLMEELDLLLEIVKLPNGMSLRNAVLEKFNNNAENEIKDLFDETVYNKLAEDRIVNFIEQNSFHLPMYAHSLWVRMILHGLQRSPMFYPM